METTSQNVIPTTKVNAMIKDLGLGLLTVKKIKEIGLTPVFEIDGGKGGAYWSIDTPEKVRDHFGNRIKVAKKKGRRSYSDSLNQIRNQNEEILQKLNKMLEFWDAK